MQLYIVRHAYAGQNGDPRYPNDDLRPLTRPRPQAIQPRDEETRPHREFEPKLVASSPLVRCRQTAEVICEHVGPTPELIELDSLLTGSHLEALVSWSNEQGVEELAWVGHAPDVNYLTAALVGEAEHSLKFAKGTTASIHFDSEIAIGQGQAFEWFTTPKVLGK